MSLYHDEAHAALVTACELLDVPYEGKTPTEMLRDILGAVRALKRQRAVLSARLNAVQAALSDDGA